MTSEGAQRRDQRGRLSTSQEHMSPLSYFMRILRAPTRCRSGAVIVRDLICPWSDVDGEGARIEKRYRLGLAMEKKTWRDLVRNSSIGKSNPVAAI